MNKFMGCPNYPLPRINPWGTKINEGETPRIYSWVFIFSVAHEFIHGRSGGQYGEDDMERICSYFKKKQKKIPKKPSTPPVFALSSPYNYMNPHFVTLKSCFLCGVKFLFLLLV